MGITVGIDLGTTNSVVARINPETIKPEIINNSMGQLMTPSAILFSHDGSIICGEEAKAEYEMGDPGSVGAFKRHLGTDNILIKIDGKGYTARELSTIFLKHLKDDAEKTLGESITEAVITVPAYFDIAGHEDIFLAARDAGLRVKYIINETVAAALYYYFTYFPEQRTKILVYDLGGGAFDVSVVEINPAAATRRVRILACRGDSTLGGCDWDRCLYELLLQKYVEEYGVWEYNIDEDQSRAFRSRTEYIKHRLSQKENITAKIYLEDDRIFFGLTRDEFNAATRHLLDRTISLVDHALDTADCSDNDLDAVLMIGGGAIMPQVREMLHARFGDKVRFSDPCTAVAKGAALASNIPLF